MLSSGPDSVVFRGKRYHFQAGYEVGMPFGGDYASNGSDKAKAMLKRFRKLNPDMHSIASHHLAQGGRDWWGVYARRGE